MAADIITSLPPKGSLLLDVETIPEWGEGHIDLAGGKPVLAGGEVKIVGGRIKYIDNTSGHYLPEGDSAKNAALKAFRENGFNVSDERYIEKKWDFKLKKWVPKT